jgi:hypothetical protein
LTIERGVAEYSVAALGLARRFGAQRQRLDQRQRIANSASVCRT